MTTKSEPRLLVHLERYLGPLAGGVGPDTTGVPLTIGAFEQLPLRGSVAYATIGLSHHRLRNESNGREFRIELLALLHAGAPAMRLPALLAQVASWLLASHRAPLCGDVIGPYGPLWDGSRLEAFYVTAPAYLDVDFAGVDLDDGGRCVIAWLVPITAREAAFVASHAWERFEDLLVSEDPDLLDPDRAEMVSICR